jgi:hypothetical protein
VDQPLGTLCEACRRELNGRARRIARWFSLATTAAFGAYAMLALPPDRTARMVGAAATVVWFMVSRRVAFQVVRTWIEERGDGKRETGNGGARDQ